MLPQASAVGIQESGNGRYDIALIPKENRLPGIVMELKAQKNCTPEELRKLAEDALEQIASKNYDERIKALGVKQVLHYGVAFSGKCVEIEERQIYNQ